jgi:uncharacterized protein YicC (UPF0701 family)
MKYSQASDIMEEFFDAYREAREAEGWNLTNAMAMQLGMLKVYMAWMLEEMPDEAQIRWSKKLCQRAAEERSTIVAKQDQLN